MWKPIYEYKLSLWTKIKIFLNIFIAGALWILTIGTGGNPPAVCISLVVSFLALVYLFRLSWPSRIKNFLRKENIEFYDKTIWDNLWFVRNDKNLIGIFNLKKKIFVYPAQYSKIITKGNYLFLEKDGKCGAVNLALNKTIIPCEYDYISYNEENGNVIGTKGTKREELSPYGSLIKEYDIRDEISKIFDKIIDSSGR